MKLGFLISLLVLASGAVFGEISPVLGPGSFANEDAFLDYVEHQTFNYFWAEANPANGLIRDRSTQDSPCSIAAVGFGLSSLAVAIERGWVPRRTGAARVLTTLETLYRLPQGPGAHGVSGYKGWFYHFLDLNSGLRTWQSELSTIDTGLLMLGVIDAGLFFDHPTDPTESRIRQLSDALVNRLDWNWVRLGDDTVAKQWTPEHGFPGGSGWVGYNEMMCLYLLGMGAASNPLPAKSWTVWTSGYHWSRAYGCSYVAYPSHFIHHYSHVWVDFRGIADGYMRSKGIDYFENSRRATLVQQAYGQENPKGFPNYGPNEWGLTACDGPNRTVRGVTYVGYQARGCPSGFDDGTIAPTAALGSLPFAPEICRPAAWHFYRTYTNRLWTTEGFRDAYNIQAGNWFDEAALGIDQGPIVLMLENYRTGSLWHRMLKSPILQRGLERAGFTAPPPDLLTARAVASNQWQISWRDNTSYEAGFQVEHSRDGVNFTTAARLSADVTNTLVRIPAGTTGYFRVRTTSAAGLSGVRETLRF